jgi:hypothetical protein
MKTNGNGRGEREKEKEGATTCPHPQFQGVGEGAGRENIEEEVVIQEDISAGEEGAGAAGERNGEWGGKARDEKGNNRGGGMFVDEIVEEDLAVRNTRTTPNLH